MIGSKALRGANALRTLPVYPVFEEETLVGSVKSSVKQKIALKGDYRTYIVAADFICAE